jgi:hypothetical protein
MAAHSHATQYPLVGTRHHSVPLTKDLLNLTHGQVLDQNTGLHVLNR